MYCFPCKVITCNMEVCRGHRATIFRMENRNLFSVTHLYHVHLQNCTDRCAEITPTDESDFRSELVHTRCLHQPIPPAEGKRENVQLKPNILKDRSRGPMLLHVQCDHNKD